MHACIALIYIISSLKNKSSNISTYSTKIIKSIKSLLSPLLSDIINKSFTTVTTVLLTFGKILIHHMRKPAFFGSQCSVMHYVHQG